MKYSLFYAILYNRVEALQRKAEILSTKGFWTGISIMKLGIAGLPNVGKSTLFNSLTKAGAESANYPFCTIDPNVGVVAVPDERLGKLADLYHSVKVTPAVIEFVDIAGLVKGASKGEGLGNQFLANIREVDAIVHVVRCFEDPNVIHVDGSIDPLRDIETINLELIFSDLDILERRIDKAVKAAKEHCAHIMVAVLGKEENLVEKGRLFTKVVAACCRQDYATGIYTSGVVFEPRFYEGFANMMKDDELPIFNWIWFGLYRSEGGMNAYTYGMDVFGKDEMEVLDADAQPDDLRNFLASLVSYVLEGDVELHDGETIGFAANDKHTITRSPGVSLPEEQMTLKISWEPSDDGPDGDEEDGSGGPDDSKEDGKDDGPDDSMSMDDASWHLENIEEKELSIDPINAYNHMAIYLRWCMEHDLMSEKFLENHGDVAKQLKAAPCNTDLRTFIREELYGCLFSALFNPQGRAFAHYYYGENDAPYYPGDVDDYALRYFGPERYHSDEFQDEAYLFIPFDEEYYQAMAKVIEERFSNWQSQDFDEDTLEPSDVAQAMMRYLDCECTYFPSMKDDDPIMSAYSYAQRLGIREGFVPVLIIPDETLLDCLVMNSDPANNADCYGFDRNTVTEYRKKMLAAPMKDGQAVLEELTGQRREEAEDDDMDWEEEILGEMEGGYKNYRFAGYWNHGTPMTHPLILARIPVKNPWEIFAYLPFGNWNDCPDTPDLMAAAKYWFEQYGAVPAAMSHDELEFLLPAPIPEKKAMETAAELYGFCPDVIDQGPEDATLGALADVLRQSTVWYLWWD